MTEDGALAAKANFDVVTFGEAMVLLLAEQGMPLDVATSFRRSVAGAESTVAIGLARLGRRTAWIGRVGDDQLGEMVLRTMRAEGVDLSGASKHPTSATGVLVRDCLIDRPISVVYYRENSAGSHLSPTDLNPDLIASSRILHGSGITPMLSESADAASRHAFMAAKEAGVLVSFDPNLRKTIGPLSNFVDTARAMIKMADFVAVTQEEMRLLSDCTSISDGCDWLLQQGPKFIAVKMGGDGCVGTDGTSTWHAPGLSVHVTDRVGAGDAWTVGFLDAFLDGHDYERCMQEGNLVAAMAIQVPTDLDGLPNPRQRSIARAGVKVYR
jgi:2-dehydro-3-deoxygluconokinase